MSNDIRSQRGPHSPSPLDEGYRLAKSRIIALKEILVKFLVLWHLDVGRLSPEIIKAIAEQPKYGEKLEADGKLECRYHVIGSHGGAWIYKVKSNEELDLLLAMAPVYNYAHYQVLPLADMANAATVLGSRKS